MYVESFDSTEDAFAAMDAAEDAANSRLTPGQIRLRDDVEHVRYWVQAIPEYDLVIYGKVPPIAEVQPGAGFDVAENRQRGYLTGTAFSNVEPTGEHGDTHVSQVVPITPTEFVLAQRLGWPDYAALRTINDLGHRVLGQRLAQCEQEAAR